jgi:hypothetical protein
MIKAIFLIFQPGATWDRIAQARRGFFTVLAVYLLPMVVVSGAVEGWGLHHWGKVQPKFHLIRDFSAGTVLTFEVVQLALSVVMVLVSALLLLKISQTFHTRGAYTQAFTAMAHAFSPLFLLRLLDAGPSVSPWVTWGIGIMLSIWIFYQGLPRVMEPDPAHAFGLYLSTVFVMVLASGIVRVLTALYLLGYVDFRNSWLTHLFPRLFQ